MYNTKAYSATSATSPLASTTIARRDPTEHDVQIENLFKCGSNQSQSAASCSWRKRRLTMFLCKDRRRRGVAVSP